MAQPYIGEIRMFAGNFAPAGWEFCQGQVLPVSEYGELFQVIGTTYGGDGEDTFVLPDLQGRIPIHHGGGYQLAETGGVEGVTLTINQIPSHSHAWLAVGDRSGTLTSPAGALPAQSTSVTPYLNEAPDTDFAAGAAAPTGGSQPHSNLQPYLCVSFIISLYGILPSPT